MSEHADLLLTARWVIPVEPHAAVLDHQSVAIRDGRIIGILPSQDAHTRFSAAEEKRLPDHALIPGLVNLHTHAAMTLMRGMADDLPLMQWLEQAIWPTEARHMSPAFVRDGTTLAIAEMLRGGITTANEMYFYPGAAAEAFDALGMRAVIGITTIEFPTPYASSADDYLRKGLEARDQWRSHPLIGFTLAPHAPYTITDETFARVVSLANELDLPIHIHVHETAHEVAESVKQHGQRPLHRLDALGVLGSNFIGVHAVHLDSNEIELLARHSASVAHCPSSNMKLASGIAPIAALAERGVNIGLGTDGAASNNRLDLFQEMRHAALLAKVSSGDASVLPAADALRMATLNGASALGMAAQIGSIEVGKQADLCAIDLSTAETQPCFNPVSHLVYCAGRENISDVWVAGRARVEGGKLLYKSNSELLEIARTWQNKLGSQID